MKTMRKVTALLIALIFLDTVFAGCSKEKTTNPVETTEKNSTIVSTTTKPLENNIFAELPETFVFASGAGAWRTDVHIEQDGTFTGFYADSDMGDSGDGYQNGTRYESHFNGKFTEVKKVSEFEYSMKIEYLHTEGAVGEEKIIDEVKVVTSEPYGFDHASEFRLYLPGRSTADLPEEFLSWIYWAINDDTKILPSYGLYNVGGQEGFFAEV